MVPAGEHWALIEIVTIHIPGDLRSQQAPGHGYPERDEDFIQYTPFTGEKAKERCLAVLETSQRGNLWRKITAVHVTETFVTEMKATAVQSNGRT